MRQFKMDGKIKMETPKPKTRVQVVIPIDSVGNIFSDFDFRDINIRLLSDDFVREVKNQAKSLVEEGEMEIVIVAPKSIQGKEFNRSAEEIVKRRIKNFFTEEFESLLYTRKKKILHSTLFICSGLASFLIVKIMNLYEPHSFFTSAMYDLVTFASWFATWHGIDKLDDLPEKREIRLLQRICNSKVICKFIKSFDLPPRLEFPKSDFFPTGRDIPDKL